MTIPTQAWSETSPAGSDNINQGDNKIREMKTQVREVMDNDHQFNSSGSDADNGHHKKCTFLEQADLGTGAEGKPILGAQTVSGKAELVFTDEDDNDIQLTNQGDFNQALAFTTGMIMMWGGTVASIPTGWQLCDGTNGSPDLRGKMIPCTAAGADPSSVSGDAYVMPHTHTGGAHTHTNPSVTPSLKIKNASDPVLDTITATVTNSTSFSNATAIGDTGSAGDVATTSTGTATAYALAYIYKT